MHLDLDAGSGDRGRRNGKQWLLIRSERGEEILSLLGDEVAVSEPSGKGKRKGAVAGDIKNVERVRPAPAVACMPNWVRPNMGWLLPRIGPHGLEFS